MHGIVCMQPSKQTLSDIFATRLYMILSRDDHNLFSTTAHHPGRIHTVIKQ